MKDFDQLIEGWKEQPVPQQSKEMKQQLEKAISRFKKASKMQYNTVIILTITLLVIIGFTLYTSLSSFVYTLGLSLMMFVLLVRIIIELYSIRTANKLNSTMESVTYLASLKKIYNTRRRIHGIATYAILLVYIIGFCILLPTFKLTLPAAFYNYIVICAWILFPILTIFITIMNRKELRILSEAINKVESVQNSLS